MLYVHQNDHVSYRELIYFSTGKPPIPAVSAVNGVPGFSPGWADNPWAGLQDPVYHVLMTSWSPSSVRDARSFWNGGVNALTTLEVGNPVSRGSYIPVGGSSTVLHNIRALLSDWNFQYPRGRTRSQDIFLSGQNDCRHETYSGSLEGQWEHRYVPALDSMDHVTSMVKSFVPVWDGIDLIGLIPSSGSLDTTLKSGSLGFNLSGLDIGGIVSLSGTGIAEATVELQNLKVHSSAGEILALWWVTVAKFRTGNYRYTFTCECSVEHSTLEGVPDHLIGDTAPVSVDWSQNSWQWSCDRRSYRTHITTGAVEEVPGVPDGLFSGGFPLATSIMSAVSFGGSLNVFRYKDYLSGNPSAYDAPFALANYPDLWKQIGITCSIACQEAQENLFTALSANHLESIKELKDLRRFCDPIALTRALLGCMRTRSPFKVGTALLDVLASVHLTHKYGISPTLASARELVVNLGPILDEIRSASWFDVAKTAYGQFSFNLEPFLGRECNLIARCEIRAGFHDSLIAGALLPATALGLAPSLSNGWDLISYSFVVDWFTNLGQRFSYLDSQLQMLLIEVHGSVVSIELTLPLTDSELAACGFESLDGCSVRVYTRRATPVFPSYYQQDWDFLLPGEFDKWNTGLALLWMNR